MCPELARLTIGNIVFAFVDIIGARLSVITLRKDQFMIGLSTIG